MLNLTLASLDFHEFSLVCHSDFLSVGESFEKSIWSKNFKEGFSINVFKILGVENLLVKSDDLLEFGVRKRWILVSSLCG